MATAYSPTLRTMLRWRHQDHLGSLRVKTDSTGAVKCRYWYYPYGELWSSTCSEKDARKFTGKERDAESGLDYFGARYFSAAQGRFTSPDAPFADQHPENPQSWNLYQYGYNNPLSNIDVDGRSVWTKAAKVIVKVAKTGNAAAAFADNVQDARTVFDSNASVGSRVLAGVSLLSEIAPISVGDIKDAGRLLGVVEGAAKKLDDVGDAAKKLPDDALVVRGGMNTPDSFAKGGGVTLDANGKLQGVSVNSAPGQTVEQLSQGIPHNKVGVTTVGQVRKRRAGMSRRLQPVATPITARCGG